MSLQSFKGRALCMALASLGFVTLSSAAEPRLETAGTNVLRVACLGDDLTLGTGLANPLLESYPAQLQTMLGERWKVLTFAADGVTALSKGNAPLCQQVIMPEALWAEADVYIILYGTHDTRMPSWTHAGEFLRDYGDLVTSFVTRPNHPRVWVCTPPPVFGTLAADPEHGKRIQQELIPKISRIAAEKQTPVIDFNKPLQGHPELFSDGIRPTAAGARRMAEIVYRELTGKSPPP